MFINKTASNKSIGIYRIACYCCKEYTDKINQFMYVYRSTPTLFIIQASLINIGSLTQISDKYQTV